MNQVNPQTRALKPVDEVRNSLTALKPQFQIALPKHIDVDKFIRVAVTAIQNNPSLLDCNRQTLYSACMKASQDGLLIDGREAAMVKFKDTVAYMPMVAGILKKIRNSGELASIAAHVVFKNDRFRYWVDSDGEHIEHEPLIFGERGERIGVYALAKMKDGAVYIEPMTIQQVLAVKNSSRSRDSGPWSGPFEEEMWRKTAIRRLSKRLPMSTDLDQVITRDDDLYDFEKPQPQTQAAEPANDEKPKRKSRMKSIVEQAVAEKQVEKDVSPVSDERDHTEASDEIDRSLPI